MTQLVKPRIIKESEVVEQYGKRVFVRDYESPDPAKKSYNFLIMTYLGQSPVVAMAITEDNNVILTRQYRHGIDEFVY